MRALLVLVLAVTAVMAAPKISTRIIGGETTTIDKYPEMVSVLYASSGIRYVHTGAGVILNNRSILTIASLFFYDAIAELYKYRVGSTFNNEGGLVFDTLRAVFHPEFDTLTMENDIAVVQVVGQFIFSDVIRPAAIAGSTYQLPDNEKVWAAGWGYTDPRGPAVTELHHVSMLTINIEVCRERYSRVGYIISDDKICAGWLDVGGRDQCDEDFGGPLYHKGTVVGLCSVFRSCGHEHFPGVNMQVSSHTEWILSHA